MEDTRRMEIWQRAGGRIRDPRLEMIEGAFLPLSVAAAARKGGGMTPRNDFRVKDSGFRFRHESAILTGRGRSSI